MVHGNIVETEAITVATKKVNKPYVGDYVNYTPQSEVTSYNVEGRYSGKKSGANFADQTINQASECAWRILNINADDTIDLIASLEGHGTRDPYRPSEQLTLTGGSGYNNGVYLLNDICNTLYSNSKYGATARSIKIEDIQDKMDLEVWDYHNYTYNDLKYGDSTTITTRVTDFANYPYLWTKEKSEKNAIDGELIQGTLGQSEQDELTLETSYRTATTSLEMTLTCWKKSLVSENFKIMPTRDSNTNSQTYLELISPGNIYVDFWLSSRICYPMKDSNSHFGFYTISNLDIKADHTIGWNSIEKSRSNLIRPIVTIPKTSLDLSADYEDTGVWELKP